MERNHLDLLKESLLCGFHCLPIYRATMRKST
jgi:hypothetical protein